MNRHRLKRRLGFGLAVSALFALGALALGAPSARANAPPCRFSTSETSVLDNDTNLIWQRVYDPTFRTWAEAKLYCDELTLEGETWRLPTVQELQTIVDESRSSPAIDQNAFPNTLSEAFWTSSVYAPNGGYVWFVYFDDGFSYCYDVNLTLHVRCVR